MPIPLRTIDGPWWTEVDRAAFGRTAVVTAASWLDGDDVATLDEDAARLLGATMARMHRHAATWSMPRGAALPELDDVLAGDRDALAGASIVDARARAVLAEARLRAQAVQTNLHRAGPAFPIHADLHPGNLTHASGTLQVLDFDDVGIGTAALDLATARFAHDDAAVRAAMLGGYAEVADLPPVTDAELDALAAGRQLRLANERLGSSTASSRAEGRTYLDTAVARLEHWLETGVFTRRPGDA